MASIRSLMTEFLANPSHRILVNARTWLIVVRNKVIDGFTLLQSRSLWYSLLLYYCRSDHDIPNELWKISREFILTVLKENDYQPVAKLYLEQFTAWKERDFENLLLELATWYSQLIDIKESIEGSRDRTTITEWQESYQAMIQKVRQAAIRLNALPRLEAIVVEIQRTKRQYVYDMLHRAYWDMLESELEQGVTTLLQCHLHELVDMIDRICPSSSPSGISLEPILAQLTTNAFGKEEAFQLCAQCMTILCSWDSKEHQRIYKETLLSLEEHRDESWATWIRRLMETSSVRAMDLLTRKQLWTILLQTEHE